MKTLFALVFCVACWSANAQQDKGVKDEGAHEAEFNTNAQERDRSAETDSRNPGDSGGAGSSVSPGEQAASPASADNAPAPTTRTTSSSGSPGVLVDDPSKPDGTNTVQRARPNIAGSAVPGSAGRADAKPTESRPTESRRFDMKPQRAVPGKEDNQGQKEKKVRKRRARSGERVVG